MKPLYSTGVLALASLSDAPPPNKDFQKDMGHLKPDLWPA
jgi:hypothetical protein